MTLADHIALRLERRGLTEWAKRTTVADAVRQNPGEFYMALAEAVRDHEAEQTNCSRRRICD